MSESMGAIQRIESKDNGAHFARCALQVNPFEYVRQYRQTTEFSDEKTYNDALVQALLDNSICAIGITDHFRVKSGSGLAEVAKAAGITVFPGFEAVSKEGVHILCLFNPDTEVGRIERYIGDCGVHDESERSPIATLTFDQIVQRCSEQWAGVSIAAHVCSSGGLLDVLRGKACIKAWTNDSLFACAIPGPASATPSDKRPIISNKNEEYKRQRPIAVVNANDVSDPTDVIRRGSSCAIKMTSPTIEALRQAFLDPESRIRLDSSSSIDSHSVIAGIS